MGGSTSYNERRVNMSQELQDILLELEGIEEERVREQHAAQW